MQVCARISHGTVERVKRQIAAARQREMVQEVAQARAEKVKGGSAANLMRVLRGK
jgi:hypothetical protein